MEAGVNQSTVTRAMRVGGPKNYSPGFMQLCNFAGIAIETATVNPRESIDAAVLRLWDRTPDGAAAIAMLLDAARQLSARK